MYLNGMGFRGIERITGIHHTTIINWVRESGEDLPEDESSEPELAELDELQTYIGRQTEKVWIWTAIDHHAPGILAMEIGDRSGGTFEKLWKRIKAWGSRRYLTDGYCVYANLIDQKKHVVLPKTQMTRAVRKLEVTSSCAPSACLPQVEGENTRLRHYLARLHRATLCYSRINSNAEIFSSAFNALFEI